MEERTLNDFIQYKRERAFEAIDDIRKMLDNGMLSAAMNRIYYAGFYIVSALLIIDNFSTSKHYQLIGYFNRNYINTGLVPVNIGKVFGEAYKNRIAFDYQDFVFITKPQAELFFSNMKEFVSFVDKLISEKLNSK